MIHAKGTYSDGKFSSIGTDPYIPTSFIKKEKSVLVCNEPNYWRGYSLEKNNGTYLDRSRFIYCGTDPYDHISAIESYQMDILYQITGSFVDIFDTLGSNEYLTKSFATVVLHQKLIDFINIEKTSVGYPNSESFADCHAK